MTNGILRPRTPQVFTDPQSEDKTAQGLESDNKSIFHFKQMYFYPLVISNLQMGGNEAQRSAKRHDLEHRLSLRILLRIHREKNIGNCWTSAIRKEYWDPIILYNLYITLNENIWTQISTTSRQFALFTFLEYICKTF